MSQIYVKCLPKSSNWTLMGTINQPTSTLISYVNGSTIANALLGVIIPIFIVSFFNISLIRLLRMRNTEVRF